MLFAVFSIGHFFSKIIPVFGMTSDSDDFWMTSGCFSLNWNLNEMDFYKGPGSSYKWSYYNSYKWGTVTGVITLLRGVITPCITGRGPLCTGNCIGRPPPSTGFFTSFHQRLGSCLEVFLTSTCEAILQSGHCH